MRDWAALNLEEKLEVLRILLIGQLGLGLNNLAILAEKGLTSADDIEGSIQLLLKTIESSQVGDATDIASYRRRLESVMQEARQALQGE